MTKVKKIGIIGAGFAGISSARIFKAYGYEVVLFEKEPDLGGVWAQSRRYPSLVTQNPKDTYNLSEMAMPKDYPEWPKSEQVQAYLQNYARKFKIFGCIRFCSEVLHSAVNAKTGQWMLRVQTEQGCIESVEVDFLIVCNGIFSVPNIPAYEGQENFIANGGKVLHTSEFTDLNIAKDKNIVVIGYGKSSCDIARACIGNSQSTTIVVRNLIWKIPKKLLNFVNFKYLFMNRFGEGMFRYHKLHGFEKIIHSRIAAPVRQMIFKLIETLISFQLKLKKNDLHPQKSFETIGNTTISLVSDGFYQAINSTGIKMIKNASVVKLSAGKALLSTGESIDADILVCGTGWRQEIPFFDQDVQDKIIDANGNFNLYRSILPINIPTLAFNGYGSSLMSQLNCEIGALWLAEHLEESISIPSIETKTKLVKKRLAWMEQRTGGKHSRGTNLIPFTLHHLDELLLDMKLSLPWLTRFKQWFVVASPKDYSHLLRELLRRRA